MAQEGYHTEKEKQVREGLCVAEKGSYRTRREEEKVRFAGKHSRKS